MSRKFNCIIWLLTLTIILPSCNKKGLSQYINPMIGASTSVDIAEIFHGLGKCFPGAETPYGMVQVSPQTMTGGDNSSGYSNEYRTIEGFSFMQMSGTGWFGEFGNFLTMPTNGKMITHAGVESKRDLGGWRSSYDKNSEIASAGYYGVYLEKYRIKTECTAAPHSGILRFTFPKDSCSRIQIDLSRRVAGTADLEHLEVVGNKGIQGWIKCTPFGGGWGDGAGNLSYVLWFYAEFSKPMEKYGFWESKIPDSLRICKVNIDSDEVIKLYSQGEILPDVDSLTGRHIGFYTEFPTEKDEQILMKAAFSFVDLDGAKKNFETELKNESFESIHKKVVKSWDKELSKIEIEGGTEEQKIIFYTSLYHSMIDPRICQDVDGRYIGSDKQIHKAEGYHRRTIFSGWDVFRSLFPLHTLINPNMVNDEVNSLINIAEESGRKYYPRWEILGTYTGCMIGNPALSIISEAYTKGIRDFDAEKALEYCVNTSEENYPSALDGYWSISSTLEHAYQDWCVYQFAKDLGKQDIANKFYKKSKAYTTVFNEEIGWFCPKDEQGNWYEWPKDGFYKDYFGTIECNPLQQGFFVPHDIEGLCNLLGGKEATISILQDLFDETPSDYRWNQYYNHANEPVHNLPFFFNRLGVPYLTQKWSRDICNKAYHNGVAGLVGNEDEGQMSAWYVLASSGIHPSNPGSEYYEICSPLFSKITYSVGKGKKFTIIAEDNSPENVYIQSAMLNGKALDECRISYHDIIKGGELKLKMGPMPSNWAIVK